MNSPSDCSDIMLKFAFFGLKHCHLTLLATSRKEKTRTMIWGLDSQETSTLCGQIMSNREIKRRIYIARTAMQGWKRPRAPSPAGAPRTLHGQVWPQKCSSSFQTCKLFHIAIERFGLLTSSLSGTIDMAMAAAEGDKASDCQV